MPTHLFFIPNLSLYCPLYSFEFGAHGLTRAHRRDRFTEFHGLAGIGHETSSDGVFAFSLASIFELYRVTVRDPSVVSLGEKGKTYCCVSLFDIPACCRCAVVECAGL